ncbi:MAG TPA: SIMPL domain-containing protein [Candidatus Binataceae bacterium]|nr:SIMPL domain-containing protein [Candidatus Binataceae bacterium]
MLFRTRVLVPASVLTFALTLASRALAQPTAVVAETPTIEVSGTGEVRAAPDVAFLSLQIETRATTAEQCSSRNAALVQKVVGELKNRLGDKGQVWTGDYSLSPDYSQPEPHQKPSIVGYVAQNSISVETGELSILGSLIDGAIATGANRINYLNFSIRDDTKPRSEAIEKAANDAKAQAAALAGALGVKLKRVFKASTLPQSRPIVPIPGMARAMAAEAAPTPIEPSQITVSATVMLTYELE